MFPYTNKAQTCLDQSTNSWKPQTRHRSLLSLYLKYSFIKYFEQIASLLQCLSLPWLELLEPQSHSAALMEGEPETDHIKLQTSTERIPMWAEIQPTNTPATFIFMEA